MEHFKIDGLRFYNMVVNASNKLEAEKDYVNSLNVFPVPDGDTGTNMSMTFRSAVNEIQNSKELPLGEMSKKLAKGALMGARGNSGVILSQILRGIAKGLEGKSEVNSEEFTNGLIEGRKSAYKAVMRPTEGTILTIIRAAGESAEKSTEKDITKLLNEVCNYSKVVLDKTPEMLPVLKQAKVVDAGGMGLLIILTGMYEALLNNLENTILKETKASENVSAAKNLGNTEIKFGYCTEFIILNSVKDIDGFKEDLSHYGDSMVVVSDDDVVKVHIHTNDPGFILSKVVKLGELTKIKIENMREQHRHVLGIENIDENGNNTTESFIEKTAENKKNAFISVAVGEGIVNILKDLGVDKVIEGGQTMNPSTQDFMDAINNINANNIYILPNNKNIIMAATQAAELSEKNVIVIPTKTIPQGITAITVFNPEIDPQDNVKNMSDAIATVKTGSVTYAVRESEADNLSIKEGDILGILDGKITDIGKDAYGVCEELINRMVDEDSELITIFYGEDCDKEKVDNMVNKLEEKYADIDLQCYKGDQPIYYFILSVE
ncbi:MAG: putative kinase [Clostridiaceae bacterium]|jgi:DAK2 domain fusion protein YloV|nr:putative kinase [Clostridiaceae bacterium]